MKSSQPNTSKASKTTWLNPKILELTLLNKKFLDLVIGPWLQFLLFNCPSLWTLLSLIWFSLFALLYFIHGISRPERVAVVHVVCVCLWWGGARLSVQLIFDPITSGSGVKLFELRKRLCAALPSLRISLNTLYTIILVGCSTSRRRYSKCVLRSDHSLHTYILCRPFWTTLLYSLLKVPTKIFYENYNPSEQNGAWKNK